MDQLQLGTQSTQSMIKKDRSIAYSYSNPPIVPIFPEKERSSADLEEPFQPPQRLRSRTMEAFNAVSKWLTNEEDEHDGIWPETSEDEEPKKISLPPIMENSLNQPSDYGSTTRLVSKNRFHSSIDWLANKFQPGSIKGSLMNLLSASLGNSIVVLPFAMSEAGWGYGSLCLLLGAYLNYYSTFLLVRTGHVSRKYSYQDMALAAYGKPFELVVKFLFFFNSWVTLVFGTILINQLNIAALNIFYGNNTLPYFLIDPSGAFWPIVCTVTLVFPVSLFRDLSSMRYVSLICFIITIYITLIVIIESFNSNVSSFTNNITLIQFGIPDGLMSCFAQVLFSFTCHPNVLDTFRELQRSSKKRMSKVLGRTMSISFLDYFLIGIFGYITFANQLGELAQSNDILLANYFNNGFITFGIVALSLANIFGLPLSAKPAKDALCDLIFGEKYHSEVQIHGEPVEHKDPLIVHFILVTFVVFSQMTVGIIETNLTNFSNAAGGIITPSICFILPCIFYLKLEPGPFFSRKKVVCFIVLLGMSAFTIYSGIKFLPPLFSNASS